MNTFELNNVRKDDIINSQLKKTSPVVEVFSALVNGESLEKFGKTGDKAVAYIKSLGEKAMNGDTNAISELNTIRRFVIEAPVMEELNSLTYSVLTPTSALMKASSAKSPSMTVNILVLKLTTVTLCSLLLLLKPTLLPVSPSPVVILLTIVGLLSAICLRKTRVSGESRLTF